MTAGIGSRSHAVSWATTHTGHAMIATEQADQFRTGDAALLMQNMVKCVDSDCGSFDTTDSSGLQTNYAVKESPVASLGSQAVRIDMVMKADDTTTSTQVLWARYGDVVICVSYLSVDPGKAQSYDLAPMVKQIASNLKLS